MNTRRSIPSVDTLLRALKAEGLPRAGVVALVRAGLAALRESGEVPPTPELLRRLQARVDARRRARLQPLINGTGVVIHTNLGRAPLAPEALAALQSVGAGYTNLEYDLDQGERGSRGAYLEPHLALLCGAEAATVTNNGAAALLLILHHLAGREGREVLVSRGELLQIGGGFRIPDILEASGARLREVGTTNRTTVTDYARAGGRDTALVLTVHRSNFFMSGFVSSPTLEELAALARRRRWRLVADLGSGAVVDSASIAGIEHEPTPAETLRHGADLVCFSGDKLLGGPQAGIIAGRARLVSALKRDPLFRALRCDKLILAGLEATVDGYLRTADSPAEARPSATPPVLALLRTSLGELHRRADAVVEALRGVPATVSAGRASGRVGGGTLPRATLESVTVDLQPKAIPLAELARRLRHGTPPVVGYVSANRFRLDLRTVFPHEDAALVACLRQALETAETAPPEPDA